MPIKRVTEVRVVPDRLQAGWSLPARGSQETANDQDLSEIPVERGFKQDRLCEMPERLGVAPDFNILADHVWRKCRRKRRSWRRQDAGHQRER